MHISSRELIPVYSSQHTNMHSSDKCGGRLQKESAPSLFLRGPRPHKTSKRQKRVTFNLAYRATTFWLMLQTLDHGFIICAALPLLDYCSIFSYKSCGNTFMPNWNNHAHECMQKIPTVFLDHFPIPDRIWLKKIYFCFLLNLYRISFCGDATRQQEQKRKVLRLKQNRCIKESQSLLCPFYHLPAEKPSRPRWRPPFSTLSTHHIRLEREREREEVSTILFYKPSGKTR